MSLISSNKSCNQFTILANRSLDDSQLAISPETEKRQRTAASLFVCSPAPDTSGLRTLLLADSLRAHYELIVPTFAW